MCWLLFLFRRLAGHLLQNRDPPGVRGAAIIALLYACGLRGAEVVSLNLADYDQETGNLIVRAKRSKERFN
jgi:site-specific recombinase XerD